MNIRLNKNDTLTFDVTRCSETLRFEGGKFIPEFRATFVEDLDSVATKMNSVPDSDTITYLEVVDGANTTLSTDKYTEIYALSSDFSSGSVENLIVLR